MLGEEHPAYATSLNNLAELYQTMGDYARAEPLYKKSVASLRKVLGRDHPSTLESMTKLVMFYMQQGMFTEAEPIIRECLSVREKKAPKDWKLFDSQSMLGGALAGQGKKMLDTDKAAAENKFSEAEPLLLSGYDGLQARHATIPAPERNRVTKALQRLVDLYELRSNEGDVEKARKWKNTLNEWLATPVPSTDTPQQ